MKMKEKVVRNENVFDLDATIKQEDADRANANMCEIQQLNLSSSGSARMRTKYCVVAEAVKRHILGLMPGAIVGVGRNWLKIFYKGELKIWSHPSEIRAQIKRFDRGEPWTLIGCFTWTAINRTVRTVEEKANAKEKDRIRNEQGKMDGCKTFQSCRKFDK